MGSTACDVGIVRDKLHVMWRSNDEPEHNARWNQMQRHPLPAADAARIEVHEIRLSIITNSAPP